MGKYYPKFMCVYDFFCGLVVESLICDRVVAGSSLTGGTVLHVRARHFILCLLPVQPRKYNHKIVDQDVKYQFKHNSGRDFCLTQDHVTAFSDGHFKISWFSKRRYQRTS